MGELMLPNSGSVYVDANVIIYSVEKIDPYSTMLQPLWQAATQGQFVVISSELLLLETLVKPIRDGDQTLEAIFKQLLTSSNELQLIPITSEI